MKNPESSASGTAKTIEVGLDPNPKGKRKELGGATRDEWNDRLASNVALALPINQQDVKNCSEAATAVFSGMLDIKPADPIEAMLVGQMVVAHEAALSMYRRGWQQPSEYFEARTKYLALADKATRTVAILSEALDRHRGRGQQQIIVKHVTVNADQAVVADQVVTGGEGVRDKGDKRPHAQAAIANAPDTPLPCAVQEDGQAVPVAGDAERPLQASRRQIAGTAERK